MSEDLYINSDQKQLPLRLFKSLFPFPLSELAQETVIANASSWFEFNFQDQACLPVLLRLDAEIPSLSLHIPVLSAALKCRLSLSIACMRLEVTASVVAIWQW